MKLTWRFFFFEPTRPLAQSGIWDHIDFDSECTMLKVSLALLTLSRVHFEVCKVGTQSLRSPQLDDPGEAFVRLDLAIENDYKVML